MASPKRADFSAKELPDAGDRGASGAGNVPRCGCRSRVNFSSVEVGMGERGDLPVRFGYKLSLARAICGRAEVLRGVLNC